MDFFSIGSVNQYAKGLARQTQWNLKKWSGDFTSHKKSLRDYVTFTKASDLLHDDERDDKLSAIVTKAQAGRKLSVDEWQYLREKNPMLYEKLKEIEQEAQNYEETLRRCKTKDEAMRVHMSKLGEIMQAAKDGDGSALYRLNRMTQTMIAFTESEEYHEMPTEAEKAIEREIERKAELEARQEEAAQKKAERESVSEEENRAESVSGEENKAESVSGEEDKAKFVPEKKKKAEFIPKEKSKVESVPKTKAKDASGIKDTSPVKDIFSVSFGHRAYLNQTYLNQRSEESREKPRRKTLSVDA